MNPFVPEMMASHGFFDQLLEALEKQMQAAARKLGLEESAEAPTVAQRIVTEV